MPTDFYFDLNRQDELDAGNWHREEGESAPASVRRWAQANNISGPLNTYAELLDVMCRDRERQARIVDYVLPEIKANKAWP